MTYLNYEEAVQKSLEYAKTINKKELIHIEDSIGRVFSKEIVCLKNLPSF